MTTATDRDAIAEVRDRVDAFLDRIDKVITAEAAAKLAAEWDSHGDGWLLDAWLEARKLEIFRDYIYRRSLQRGSQKARLRRAEEFGEFRDEFEETLAAEGAAAAREKAREFYRFHTVTEDGGSVRKSFGSLTADQLKQVSDRYRRQAKDSNFYARVTDAVRRKVAERGPAAVVSDVYTPEQLQAMFDRTQTQGE